MTGHPWLDPIIGVAAALLLAWIALIITLAIRRPETRSNARITARLLPDLLRLLTRLTTDPPAPVGTRIRIALLLIYLAAPIDLSGAMSPCTHQRG